MSVLLVSQMRFLCFRITAFVSCFLHAFSRKRGFLSSRARRVSEHDGVVY